MLVATGCGVPGVMATRTIEKEADRKIAIVTTTFMPCSAKLPIIALIAGALFAESGWVAPVCYFIGIAAKNAFICWRAFAVCYGTAQLSYAASKKRFAAYVGQSKIFRAQSRNHHFAFFYRNLVLEQL